MISEERLRELIADAWGLDTEILVRPWDSWRDERKLARAVEREATAALRAENERLLALLREARDDIDGWLDRVRIPSDPPDELLARIDAAIKAATNNATPAP